MYMSFSGIKEARLGKMNTLKNLIQDHTEKLSFLTVLKEEKTKLQKFLKQPNVEQVVELFIHSID